MEKIKTKPLNQKHLTQGLTFCSRYGHFLVFEAFSKYGVCTNISDFLHSYITSELKTSEKWVRALTIAITILCHLMILLPTNFTTHKCMHYQDLFLTEAKLAATNFPASQKCFKHWFYFLFSFKVGDLAVFWFWMENI